jgi:hypothetical protein
MKRRTSSSIPDLPAPPRRKRGLSEEERALWESVSKQVKPLRKRYRALKPTPGSPQAEASAAAKPIASPMALPRIFLHPSQNRRGWRRSDAVSARSSRAAGRKSTPGSICTG